VGGLQVPGADVDVTGQERPEQVAEGVHRGHHVGVDQDQDVAGRNRRPRGQGCELAGRGGRDPPDRRGNGRAGKVLGCHHHHLDRHARRLGRTHDVGEDGRQGDLAGMGRHQHRRR
jgi:hypothetical protein